MVGYYLFRILSALMPLLPVGLAYWLADRLGALAYLFASRPRANAEDNIRHVLGAGAKPTDVARHVRQAFRVQARNYVDLLRLPVMNLADSDRMVEVHGWEHVRAALAPGKGVIIVAAHLGNLEVVAQVAVAHGYSVTIPVEPLKPPKLFEFIVRLRESWGLKIVPANESALRQIYRALGRNEVVAMGADRDILGSGIRVPFFGEMAALPHAPALLALRTGAAIVPVRSNRLPGQGYATYVDPPFWLQSTGDRQRDIQEGARRVAAALERIISVDPGQWVMFEPVWNMIESAGPGEGKRRRPSKAHPHPSPLPEGEGADDGSRGREGADGGGRGGEATARRCGS